MEKIKNQSHNRDTFLYTISRMLERASYYGLRSLVVLYMISEVLKLSNTEALKIYGFFTASILFSRVIGALLGDLVLGNKNAIIAGGIAQSLGAFALCSSSIYNLYVGLFLVVIGSGLYTPNFISNFGKLYLNKTKLIDAGFSILYLGVNFGSFIGVLAISILGEKYGWNLGFSIAGVLVLISIIPLLISQKKITKHKINTQISTKNRVLTISVYLLYISLFWAVYEISNIRFLNVQLKLRDLSALNIPSSSWIALNSMYTIIASIVLSIIWTFFYSSQFLKLTIGFILGSISFIILFFIPEIPTEKHTILYLISLLFLSVSEIYIAPVINSILTKYTNPKYLAIAISLTYIPMRLFLFLISLFGENLYENSILAIIVAMTIMSVFSVGLIIYKLVNTSSSSE